MRSLFLSVLAMLAAALGVPALLAGAVVRAALVIWRSEGRWAACVGTAGKALDLEN